MTVFPGFYVLVLNSYEEKIMPEKDLLYADMSLEDALDFLSEKLGEVTITEDTREGITDFLENHKHKFVGQSYLS